MSVATREGIAVDEDGRLTKLVTLLTKFRVRILFWLVIPASFRSVGRKSVGF
jgi:hypothetical protein